MGIARRNDDLMFELLFGLTGTIAISPRPPAASACRRGIRRVTELVAAIVHFVEIAALTAEQARAGRAARRRRARGVRRRRPRVAGHPRVGTESPLVEQGHRYRPCLRPRRVSGGWNAARCTSWSRGSVRARRSSAAGGASARPHDRVGWIDLQSRRAAGIVHGAPPRPLRM